MYVTLCLFEIVLNVRKHGNVVKVESNQIHKNIQGEKLFIVPVCFKPNKFEVLVDLTHDGKLLQPVQNV